jgi:RNA polymerase sigma-70 factor (TIGR02960 family)
VKQTDFSVLTERHRHELQLHCYRMLGSFEDAEDAVQEALVRAWAKQHSFVSGSNLRAWLYRIATNVCLDMVRRRKRQITELHSYAEVPWLQPYPDDLLDLAGPRTDEPETAVVARETVELALIAAIQLLPARQRAVLVMRDVVGWSAAETADILEISVAAVNSALQRARRTLQHRRPTSDDGDRTELSQHERRLLQRYLELHQDPQPDAMAALVRDDIRITMPPQPVRFDGWESLAQLHRLAFGPESEGEWRLVPTAVNRMPAAACYLRAPGQSEFTAFKLDVLRIEGGLIAEITTFDGALFPRLGLASAL